MRDHEEEWWELCRQALVELDGEKLFPAHLNLPQENSDMPSQQGFQVFVSSVSGGRLTTADADSNECLRLKWQKGPSNNHWC